MLTVLDCIIEAKQKFKANEISDILTGKETSIIKTYKLDQIESFGIGKDKDKKFWNAVIRQGIIAKILDKEIENYGILKVTYTGEEFMKNPHSIMLVEDHDYDEQDSEKTLNNGGAGGGADATLLKMLKDLRKSIAKRKNVPPFVVFQDPSLDDMAIQYPITIDELANIHGVGQGKAAKFGAEFISLIKKYVEENEIERPLDLVVKSVVNKSGKKVYYIQSIDRKLSLDEIAEAKGLSFDELLSELEAIVYSGTKLNIQYYLDDVMDEDKQEDIYDYFLEAESDDIDDALDELDDDDYTDEDIRLVRIKFLSEMAN
jgi:ATP-dependent DNA helicase RecQ